MSAGAGGEAGKSTTRQDEDDVTDATKADVKKELRSAYVKMKETLRVIRSQKPHPPCDPKFGLKFVPGSENRPRSQMFKSDSASDNRSLNFYIDEARKFKLSLGVRLNPALNSGMAMNPRKRKREEMTEMTREITPEQFPVEQNTSKKTTDVEMSSNVEEQEKKEKQEEEKEESDDYGDECLDEEEEDSDG